MAQNLAMRQLDKRQTEHEVSSKMDILALSLRHRSSFSVSLTVAACMDSTPGRAQRKGVFVAPWPGDLMASC